MLTIENNQLRVGIDEMGAQVTHVIDKNGNFDFIWNGIEWKKHAPILFPAVGGSVNDQYVIDGKAFSMKPNGFASDYSWTVVDKGDEQVSLTLTDNEETLKIYPFEFSLMVTYALEGNHLHVRFLVQNNSQKTMPFALGFKPTFNIPIITDNLKFSDYSLTFEPEVPELTKYKLTDHSLREKEIYTVSGTDKNSLQLKYSDFEAGPIVIATPGLTQVDVTSEKSDHQLGVSLEEFDHVALWTMAKQEAKFLCIAPLNGLPDQESNTLVDWSQKEGNHLLEPEQKVEFSTTLTLQ
ncbi:aldose 1-epimerase family protein [uncultured Lactobacillus sp.]|uniref:aldose 1-epimerase family protein n=1 Tax=uncultured Lactobacillus sp. TaxID=153152 RepID=UPI00261475A8|nr:aldose 1-epimerase family protein [uncultured Lactobacillus sp.]